jgi:parvulin-like peptidyl-prolyl isomerase
MSGTKLKNMKRPFFIAVSALLLVTVAGSAQAADSATPVVATWQGGEARAAEVESQLRNVASDREATEPDARIEALVTRYSKAAEQTAVASLLLSSMPESGSVEIPDDMAKRLVATRRQVVLELYLRDRRAAIEISDEALKEYYDANPENFATPKRATLWNIYRRDEDGDREGTIAFLSEIRSRYLKGETFEALAREYSQSETRLRDGRVGSYADGELPEKLGTVVFALEAGEVSEPQPVSDGAVLLHVTEVAAASRASLDEVSDRIRAVLLSQKLEDEITERVADVQIPEGSTVLADGEFEAIIQGEDKDRVVLEIATFKLTAAEAGGWLRSIPAPADIAHDDDSEEAKSRRLEAGYQGIVRRALLYKLLESDPTVMDSDSRDEAEERLKGVRESLWVDEELRRQVRERAGADAEALKKFFDDNAHHFQSPLRFELRSLNAPLGDDVMVRMKSLEELRARLIAGEIDLETAAKDIGGEITDIGSKEFSELGALGAKIQTVILEAGAAAFTIPFQDEDELQLLQIVKREEPGLLPFDEAREQVVDEYLVRNQRALSKEIVDSLLAEAKFKVDEKAVRDYLLPPD